MRPKLTFSPDSARMMKQLAVSQCVNRSKLAKRRIVLPEKPCWTRIRPRTIRKIASSASMPRMAMPPIHGSLLRWKSRQSRPAGWIRLAAIASGIDTRPVILSPSFSAFRSLSS